MTSMKSIDPATGEVVGEYEAIAGAELERRLTMAAEAQRSWRGVPPDERARALVRLAAVLEDLTEDGARGMAREMGKPVKEGRAEMQKSAWVCRYYAEHGPGFLADEVVATDAARSYVTYEPLGVVLAIMPWNFPYWQVLRFAAPALVAGNVALLKHAPSVCGCSLAIEDAFARAGFPQGTFPSLLLEESRVADLIADSRVAAATLTGSVRAGRAVASAAGAHLKKTVLELGGSDAYLILEDADLEAAAEACVQSRLINCGQSCIAAKRFIVVAEVRARFEELVLARLEQARVGSPLDETTDVGPLARVELRETLHRQVSRSVELGARLALGGEVPEGPGAFYPPTLLTEVTSGMPAHDEELFGPVAVILEVPGEAAAILAANDSRFGLGAAVFTGDVARGERIAARELEAGSAFVNAFVRSDPRLPFGGVKESGYGRELSRQGVREFVNAKVVYLA